VKASISDREQLQGLDPVEIASYLQAKGWQRYESGYERAALWTIAGLLAAAGQAGRIYLTADV
jgi:hypothetical protein